MNQNELLILFNTFCDRFEKRTNSYSLMEMGEDSVRYDFFLAVMDVLGKESHEIKLEKAINRNAFNLNNTPGSKRTEKPKIDLSFESEEREYNFEFGLFRRNSNLEGNINKTARFGKFLNDALRLNNQICANQNFGDDFDTIASRGYLVYVADRKFIGYKPNLKEGDEKPFPANYHGLWKKDYENLPKSAIDRIDQRFWTRAGEFQYFPRLIKRHERYMIDCAEERFVVVCYEVEGIPHMP